MLIRQTKPVKVKMKTRSLQVPLLAFPSQYLGLFNLTNIGDPLNHVVAVEFDTIRSYEFNDTDDNHVGMYRHQ